MLVNIIAIIEMSIQRGTMAMIHHYVIAQHGYQKPAPLQSRAFSFLLSNASLSLISYLKIDSTPGIPFNPAIYALSKPTVYTKQGKNTLRGIHP